MKFWVVNVHSVPRSGSVDRRSCSSAKQLGQPDWVGNVRRRRTPAQRLPIRRGPSSRDAEQPSARCRPWHVIGSLLHDLTPDATPPPYLSAMRNSFSRLGRTASARRLHARSVLLIASDRRPRGEGRRGRRPTRSPARERRGANAGVRSRPTRRSPSPRRRRAARGTVTAPERVRTGRVPRTRSIRARTGEGDAGARSASTSTTTRARPRSSASAGCPTSPTAK